MTLKESNGKFIIEDITPDDLGCIYQAVLHTPLPFRGGAMYGLKTQIENHISN